MKAKKKSLNQERGFLFLEVLISAALISITFITLLSIGFISLNTSTSIRNTSRANALIREEFEAVRSFRDGSTWGSGGVGAASTGSSSPYHLSLNNSTNPPSWQLDTGTETVDEFTRKIVFDKVSRDPSTQNIESTYNASHDDPNTRKITVTVSSTEKTYQVVTYLTNWKP